MYTSTSSNKSPLKFFLLVFALAIPLWVIGTMVKVKGLPLDVPVTDFIAAFIPLIAACILWSGYAVDALQERWSALTTAIIVGLVWAILHYPSIIQQGHDLIWIAWATLGLVGMRILIVWLYNNTGKSVFVCILFHSIANIGRILFPKDQNYNPLVDYPDVHYSIIAITAMIVVFLWGSKTLARYRYSGSRCNQVH